ncbi:hypothetical protein C8Q72DRAFT_880041 [Fomitopsis betulina]|nr:hypothetical protein C8Q72DRAFT_880041 [Fomitopsis betulina]
MLDGGALRTIREYEKDPQRPRDMSKHQRFSQFLLSVDPHSKFTMRSAVVFAVLAAVVSAVPLVEKRTGGEAYATPPDIEKRTGGEAYATPPDIEERTGGEAYITPPDIEKRVGGEV